MASAKAGPPPSVASRSKFTSSNLNALHKPVATPATAGAVKPPPKGMVLLQAPSKDKSKGSTGGKCLPPMPVQLRSLKAENRGHDPGINLVPVGGPGWGKKAELPRGIPGPGAAGASEPKAGRAEPATSLKEFTRQKIVEAPVEVEVRKEKEVFTTTTKASKGEAPSWAKVPKSKSDGTERSERRGARAKDDSRDFPSLGREESGDPEPSEPVRESDAGASRQPPRSSAPVARRGKSWAEEADASDDEEDDNRRPPAGGRRAQKDDDRPAEEKTERRKEQERDSDKAAAKDKKDDVADEDIQKYMKEAAMRRKEERRKDEEDVVVQQKARAQEKLRLLDERAAAKKKETDEAIAAEPAPPVNEDPCVRVVRPSEPVAVQRRPPVTTEPAAARRVAEETRGDTWETRDVSADAEALLATRAVDASSSSRRREGNAVKIASPNLRALPDAKAKANVKPELRPEEPKKPAEKKGWSKPAAAPPESAAPELAAWAWPAPGEDPPEKPPEPPKPVVVEEPAQFDFGDGGGKGKFAGKGKDPKGKGKDGRKGKEQDGRKGKDQDGRKGKDQDGRKGKDQDGRKGKDRGKGKGFVEPQLTPLQLLQQKTAEPADGEPAEGDEAEDEVSAAARWAQRPAKPTRGDFDSDWRKREEPKDKGDNPNGATLPVPLDPPPPAPDTLVEQVEGDGRGRGRGRGHRSKGGDEARDADDAGARGKGQSLAANEVADGEGENVEDAREEKGSKGKGEKGDETRDEKGSKGKVKGKKGKNSKGKGDYVEQPEHSDADADEKGKGGKKGKGKKGKKGKADVFGEEEDDEKGKGKGKGKNSRGAQRWVVKDAEQESWLSSGKYGEEHSWDASSWNQHKEAKGGGKSSWNSSDDNDKPRGKGKSQRHVEPGSDDAKWPERPSHREEPRRPDSHLTPAPAEAPKPKEADERMVAMLHPIDEHFQIGAGVVCVKGDDPGSEEDGKEDEFETVKSKKQQKADKLDKKRRDDEEAKKEGKRKAKQDRREAAEAARRPAVVVAADAGDEVAERLEVEVVQEIEDERPLAPPALNAIASQESAGAVARGEVSDHSNESAGGASGSGSLPLTGADPPLLPNSLPPTGGFPAFGPFGAIGTLSSQPSKEIVAIWERPTAVPGLRPPPPPNQPAIASEIGGIMRPTLRSIGRPPPYPAPRATKPLLRRFHALRVVEPVRPLEPVGGRIVEASFVPSSSSTLRPPPHVSTAPKDAPPPPPPSSTPPPPSSPPEVSPQQSRGRGGRSGGAGREGGRGRGSEGRGRASEDRWKAVGGTGYDYDAGGSSRAEANSGQWDYSEAPQQRRSIYAEQGAKRSTKGRGKGSDAFQRERNQWPGEKGGQQPRSYYSASHGELGGGRSAARDYYGNDEAQAPFEGASSRGRGRASGKGAQSPASGGGKSGSGSNWKADAPHGKGSKDRGSAPEAVGAEPQSKGRGRGRGKGAAMPALSENAPVGRSKGSSRGGGKTYKPKVVAEA